jgi:BirA family transcriptional regulator, biotin operon repressor / biotin---[acetyl-CoA-carboxylase] ligase
MIETREIARRLTTLESVAIIPRVASTNLVARRIVTECIENELSLPQAIIVAREQFAGRGRNQRSWSSPAGKGIYATTMLMRPVDELALLPLAIANIVAGYLRATFGIEAGIKWPNDIYAGGRKIAGILLEARISEERAFVIVGTGINLEPVNDDTRPNATSVRELAADRWTSVDVATVAFIEFMDRGVSQALERDAVLADWRRLSIHRDGDSISCVLGERTVEGRWQGIDDHGRAQLRAANGETIAVSAGDLILT